MLQLNDLKNDKEKIELINVELEKKFTTAENTVKQIKLEMEPIKIAAAKFEKVKLLIK